MGLRENFQKLLDKKQQEVRALELNVREYHIYIQALQDSMKMLPKENADAQATSTEHLLGREAHSPRPAIY